MAALKSSFKDQLRTLKTDLKMLSTSIRQTGPEDTTKTTITNANINTIRVVPIMQNQVTQTQDSMVRRDTEAKAGGSYRPGQEIAADEIQTPRRYHPSKYFSDDDESSYNLNGTSAIHDYDPAARMTVKNSADADVQNDGGDERVWVLRPRPLTRKCYNCRLFKCGCRFPMYQ